MKKKVVLAKYLNCYEVVASIHECIVLKESYQEYRQALEEVSRLGKEFKVKVEYVVIKREKKLRW